MTLGRFLRDYLLVSFASFATLAVNAFRSPDHERSPDHPILPFTVFWSALKAPRSQTPAVALSPASLRRGPHLPAATFCPRSCLHGERIPYAAIPDRSQKRGYYSRAAPLPPNRSLHSAPTL